MIVVLCNSYQEAMDAFDIFITLLNDIARTAIKNLWPHSLMVETDEDLRYIFVDGDYAFLFDDSKDDIIMIEEFFEGIPYYYAWCEGEVTPICDPYEFY